MSFLEENVLTPPDRKPPVTKEELKHLGKLYGARIVAERIFAERKDLNLAKVPTTREIIARYYPTAVTLRNIERENGSTNPIGYWDENAIKKIVKAYPNPIKVKKPLPDPVLLTGPTALQQTYISYPEAPGENLAANMFKSLGLSPEYQKVSNGGSSGFYTVKRIQSAISQEGHPYYLTESWDSALKLTNKLVAELKERIANQGS